MKIISLFLCSLVLMSCAGISQNDKPGTVQDFNSRALFYYSLAESSIQMKNLPDAIILLKKAEIEDENNLEIRERLTEVMSMASLYELVTQQEIIALGEKYYRQDKHTAKILRFLAEAYRKTEQFENADKYLKIALQLESSQRNYSTYYFFQKTYFNNTDTLLLEKALASPWERKEDVVRIAHYYSEFNLDRAIEILIEGYEKWDDLTTLSALLQYYNDTGGSSEIIELLQNRVDRNLKLAPNMQNYLIAYYFNTFQNDKILLNQQICLESESEQILKFLFFAGLSQSDYQVTIKAGHLLEDLDNTDPGFDNTLKGYLGYSYFKEKHDNMALEYFLETDSIDVIMEIFHDLASDSLETERTMQLLDNYTLKHPNHDLTNLVSGYTYALLEMTAEAGERLDRISFDFLEENDFVLPVALTYVDRLNDPGKARELLSKRENPDPSLEEFFAIYYYDSRQDSLAYEYIIQVLMDEKKPDVSIYLLSSFLAERMDKVSDILPYLEKGPLDHPDNPEMMNMLGYLIANNGISEKYTLAEDLIKGALEISPDNGMIWDSLAWLYYQKEQYGEALEAMQILLDSQIENSEIAYHLGAIYYFLENKAEAVRYLTMAVELKNDDKAVKKAIEFLELIYSE